MKTKIFISLLMLIIVFSCENEKNENFLIENNLKSIEINPYDIIGEFHNAMLDVIANHNDSIFQDGFNEELFKSAIVYAIDNYSEQIWSDLGVTININNYNQLKDSCLSFAFNNDMNSFLTSEYTTIQLDYYNTILDIIKDSTLTESSIIFTKINEIETQIINSNDISEIEMVQLLISSSIAKYSWMYWDNQKKLGDLSPWNKLFEGFPRFKEETPMMHTINSDIEGGASGGLIGGYLGGTGGTVIFPGAGTITGAVSGAIVGGAIGAVGASAFIGGCELYQAGKDWWDSW